jgi:hypothetical protein
MAFLEDDLGNKSMMRKIVWVLTIAFVAWGTAEITAYIWMAALDKIFVVHTGYLLAGLGIVLGGKATQKGIEMFQKPKTEQ